VELNNEWYQASELAHSATLAQARYHEANCILYALEYPGASSSEYSCGEQLVEYVEALGVDQCEDWDFDPEFSSISEALAWPLVSMQPTATPIPPTATPRPPTATPKPPTATSTPRAPTPVPPTATRVPPSTGTGTVVGRDTFALVGHGPPFVDWSTDFFLYAAPQGLPSRDEVCSLSMNDAVHLISDRTRLIQSTVLQADHSFRFENVPTGIPLFVSNGFRDCGKDYGGDHLACIIGSSLFTLSEGETRDVGNFNIGGLYYPCTLCCPCGRVGCYGCQ
jgi:hypothetical protein